jgi:outer membrane protein
MLRSLAVRAGLLCFALAPFAGLASAQVKVAVVNVQKAMLESDELKKASAEMEAKFKPRQDELTKLQSDLQSIQQQLGSGRLTPQASADLQAQGAKKQREAQRIADDLQADIEREKQEILARASTKMQEILKKLAEDKGYDVVIDVTQAVYFKPALEITNDALAAYNKAYPVK